MLCVFERFIFETAEYQTNEICYVKVALKEKVSLHMDCRTFAIVEWGLTDRSALSDSR